MEKQDSGFSFVEARARRKEKISSKRNGSIISSTSSSCVNNVSKECFSPELVTPSTNHSKLTSVDGVYSTSKPSISQKKKGQELQQVENSPL